MRSAGLTHDITGIAEVFPWSENFETGIPLIDRQHKRLVQLINSLASHLAYQADVPTLNNIFNELAEYAAYHFQSEENVWGHFVPGDALEMEHKEAHSRFVSDLLKLKAEGGVKPSDKAIEDILSFLTHWLAFHILDSDKRMSMIALMVQSGMSVDQAKSQADNQMSGALKVLIETILSMYDSLSSRTLQLMREIMERQKAEAKLRLAANVFDNTLEAICITDADAVIVDVNPAFHLSTEYAYNEVIGNHLKAFKSGFTDEAISTAIWNAVKQQGHWMGEIQSRTKSGEYVMEWLTLSAIKNDEGEIDNYVGVFSNITQLMQRQHKLERIANHDALTGLPNRLLLVDRLELAIAHAERTQEFLAVCYLDLDGFKPVNDHYGHAIGDQVLRETAQRLKKVVRGNDTVARLGGDEFIILFGELKRPEDCRELLDRLLEEIGQPINIKNDAVAITVTVTASIGVSIFPADDGDADAGSLLQKADQAMYQAKRQGKSRYRFYDMAT